MVQSKASRVARVRRSAVPVDLWGVAGWLFLASFGGILFGVSLVILIVGLPYYLTPLDARPDHTLDPWFSSGSPLGLYLGIVGTGLMLFVLLYSARKWLPLPAFFGTSQFWMRFHQICGVLGPVFIVLHAELRLPYGFIGVGFWCMVLVAASGFFGRYLFGYFPASATDRKLNLQDAMQRLTELREQLVADTRDSDSNCVADAVALARDFDLEPQTIGELVVLDTEIRRRREMIRALLHRAGLTGEAYQRAEGTLLEQLSLRRSMAGFDAARRLLRFWNLLHQPLAFAMYAIVLLHILNAVFFGGVIATLLGVER
ncbi:MAG: hypothetical protein ABMA64_29415 [Myxococcota bacterium]